MNICFLYDGKLVTSPIKGTILDGAESGRLTEAFGTGTAVVVSPVGTVTYRDRTVSLNGGQAGELPLKLYETLTGIQCGKITDPHGWVEIL